VSQVITALSFCFVLSSPRSQYPEGPGTCHLGTGFSWFLCVHKRMLRWFSRLQVATACFLFNPPDLDYLDPYFIFMYMRNNHCHQVTVHLQLNVLLLLLLLLNYTLLTHILSGAELLYMSLQIILLVCSDSVRFLINIWHLKADRFTC
jgi:hypothetical protein